MPSWLNKSPGKWEHRARAWLAMSAVFLVSLLALDLIFPPPLDKAEEVSRVVEDRQGAPLRAYPISEGRWRMRADLSKIDPDFVEALLAYEDKRYYRHFGVDVLATLRAAKDSLGSGRVVSGASTITMQTARLLEPQERTILAKLRQMARAVQLERRLSKEEILELYLTLAPYGGNLEGVRAASWAWFEREPMELTPDEIALLIALPQSPEARRPDLRPDNARVARARVLQRLVDNDLISRAHALEYGDAGIPKRHDFPAFAWQASDAVLAEASQNSDVVISTLDLGLQTSLEQFVLRQSEKFDEHAQIAVMVVDVETRAVRAAIGSATRNRPGGWLDLTHRVRSPGSTLKPFIYAMAFDDGIAAPQTRISDLPKRFASYRPENFDRTFRGDVTISEALQHSLNVPAVQALEAVGPRRFAAALRFAGVSPQLPEDAELDAGLALALGGAGMTMRDLATLYTALGDSGEVSPLRWVEMDDVETTHVSQLMSPASAHRVLEILRTAPTPEGRMPAMLTQDAPEIAFKTGTSYGFRDAWAAGISNGYVVVVWVGRADGAPRPGATGRKTALPILFDVFDLAVRQLRPQIRRDELNLDQPEGDAPFALATFEKGPIAPEILFPPDGAEIWSPNPGREFVLAARGQGRLAWYADGHPLSLNAAGDPIWTPDKEGFYTLSVVDPGGRSSRTKVRIVFSAS